MYRTTLTGPRTVSIRLHESFGRSDAGGTVIAFVEMAERFSYYGSTAVWTNCEHKQLSLPYTGH